MRCLANITQVIHTFTVHSGLKKEDIAFEFCLEFVISKARRRHEGLEFSVLNKVLVYADDIFSSVLEKIKYRHNWVNHFHRMNNSRFPKALMEYHPRGRRRLGRPLKRFLDGVQIETETGHMGLIS
jgi:hypothetical protein